MSSDNKAEISIDDVEVLMSNLQRQFAQHPASPPIAGTEEQPVSALGTVFAHTMEITSNLSSEENAGSTPLLPSFLAEHNVAEAIRRANLLYIQRVGHPAVFSSRFDPAFLQGGGTAFGETAERLNSLDFHPSFGPSGYESFPGEEARDLPPRFASGQESASVLQITKRPKLRAKDVAHRQSLTTSDFSPPASTPRFWDLDSSLFRAGPGHTPPATPVPGRGGPDTCLRLTLVFGTRAISTSASLSMPVREVQAMAARCAERETEDI